MTAPERHSQFDTRSATAMPVSFSPARLIGRDRWGMAKRFALIAAATLGVWLLLLAPGGRILA